MSLAELRRELGISQAAVAAELGKSQAATHKTEWSSDPLLSTWDAYLRAVGRVLGEAATLELTAIVGRRRIALAPPARAEDDEVQQSTAEDTEQLESSVSSRGSSSAQQVTRAKGAADGRSRKSAEVIASLDRTLVGAAQIALTDLVQRTQSAGKRGILVDHHEVIGDFFTAFARHCGRPAPGGTVFGGRSGEPGLWHALQELCPIDDTNWWDRLRKEVIDDLIAKNRWERIGSSPRGSEFKILDQ